MTGSVPGSLASASAGILPSQPMSRKRSSWVLSAPCASTRGPSFSRDVRAEEVARIGEPLRRQHWIKERRIAFIRCRRWEELWGSHHVEARFASARSRFGRRSWLSGPLWDSSRGSKDVFAGALLDGGARFLKTLAW